MDFMQRGDRPSQPATQPAREANSVATGSSNKKSRMKSSRILRYVSASLLFSIAILLVALTAFLVYGDKGKNESKYVNTKQMQAVFLNGGQVYFGNISTLNSQYYRLTNIYYLRVNQTVQPNQTTASTSANDVSLVKLGCELHGPVDEMLINQSQVVFWENLKTDGQVAKAVAEFVKQNPNGQKCDTAQSTNTTAPAATTKKP
jgi:hypothetical protein